MIFIESGGMPMLKESAPHKATFITISSDEYDSMKATIEVLSDKELMEQIRESKTAKSRPFGKVTKELGV